MVTTSEDRKTHSDDNPEALKERVAPFPALSQMAMAPAPSQPNQRTGITDAQIDPRLQVNDEAR